MKKPLKDYTHEELLKLPIEEVSKLFDIDEEQNLIKRSGLSEEEYHKLGFNEKVKYWSGELGRQMRRDLEEGIDPYSIFSLDWYEEVKTIEPDVGLIMDTVFSKYWSTTGVDWDKNIYNLRIKTDYKPFRMDWIEFVRVFKDYNRKNYKDFILKANSKGIIINKGNYNYYLFDEKSIKDLIDISNIKD